MALPTSLSNCYVPLPLPDNDNDNDESSSNDDNEKNADIRTGRGPLELRRVGIETNLFGNSSSSSNTMGSSLVRIGDTQVLCKVLGPLTGNSVPPSVELDLERGVLQVQVQYAVHIGYPTDQWLASVPRSLDENNNNNNNNTSMPSSGKIKSWTAARETNLQGRIFDAISAAVPLEPYPKTLWQVHLTVLRDDGGIFAAALLATSLGMMDAGLDLYDVVCGSSVAVLTGNHGNPNPVLLADPTEAEIAASDAHVTLAVLPNQRQTIHYQQSRTAGLSPAVANQALQVCRNGCRTMHQFLRQHWVDRAEDRAAQRPQEEQH